MNILDALFYLRPLDQELTKVESQCEALFGPMVKRAKQLSAVAQTAIQAIAKQGILSANAPAKAFHFTQLKAAFVVAMKELQGVAPLFQQPHQTQHK